MKYRQPAVAGRFYPDTPKQLQAQLDNLFEDLTPQSPKPTALIVPHAGYLYSGRVAAHAYATVRQYADQIKRVILFGPSHRCYLESCAVSGFAGFSTPLGNIPIDSVITQHLKSLGLIREFEPAHALEHSLEVQLPFLQYCLNDFTILPIVVGSTSPQNVGLIMRSLSDLPDTLFVISTDLSHFHSYTQAQQLDSRTIERILHHEATLEGQDACGCHAVNGLLNFVASQQLQCQLLDRANSGDINNHLTEVVGYASFIVY